MKAKIIALSKEPIVGGHNLLLKFKRNFFFAKLEPDEANQLLSFGNFKEVEEGWYEVASSKGRTSKITKNLKSLVYRFYGIEDLSESVEEWTKFVTLCIDREYLPCDQYDDLVFFLYQLKDILNQKKTNI